MVDTEIPPEEAGEPVGPDDWYNVGPEGPEDSTRTADGSGAITTGAFDALATRQNRLIAGIALMLLLAGALGFLVWRRKRAATSDVEVDEGPSLARGVSQVIGQQMSASVQDIGEGRDTNAAPREPEPRPAQPSEKPAPAPAPASSDREPQEGLRTAAAAGLDPDLPSARLDLALDIIGATRSMMMFTLDFRLELANRSDRAVRDLSIAGKLASAQRGGSNAAPVAGGQLIGDITRIGPQQSRAIIAQLQLPLSEVTPILQGRKPLLIPLLHLTIEGKGCPAMSRSYVIGTPSQSGTGRVHPLPLDGLPGGLSDLRAQLVKTFGAGVQAETI